LPGTGVVFAGELAGGAFIERKFLFPREHWQRPASLISDPEPGNGVAQEADLLKSGGKQIATKVVLRKQAHLERRADAAVKHQVIPDLEGAIFRPIDQDRRAGERYHGELVQAGESLDG